MDFYKEELLWAQEELFGDNSCNQESDNLRDHK